MAYLIEQNGRTVLVDAGMPGEAEKILRMIKSAGVTHLDLIFLTHAHIDHCGSAAAISDATKAPIAIHQADADALAKGETRLGTVRGRGKLMKWLFPLIDRIVPTPPTTADIVLEDGQNLLDHGFDAEVLHTPGHTYGSSTLLVDEAAFVGDLVTIVRRGSKLQSYYAESWSMLVPSLEKLVSAGPVLIYPGHGKRAIRLSEIKALYREHLEQED
jgi:glyoxylase-like metal-dependent hydrolase (beta-lactamase superfamily II)